MIKITPELLERYDKPGPRYTSYPTAVEFAESFGPADYAERLAGAARHPADPLSLYVHLPFCEARCSFCGCHVVVARRQSVADVYLDRVLAEADLVVDHLGERRTLAQYHWGGGTPTYYASDDLAAFHRALLQRFELAPDAEVAVEVDPRVTGGDHLAVLRELGFNRVSMGVQDLDPEVQELIGRNQNWEETRDLHLEARRLDFDSINIDLIYGLPGQTIASFTATLERVLELRPDRLAVYSFAYVPWVKPNQKRIDQATLPDRDTKFALLALVSEGLVSAGYRAIGMDHFALPGDELSLALNEGTLSRNFMGYTTKRGTEMVALGTSGISDVAGAYAQNHKRLNSYYTSVDTGELPVERGLPLSRDDRIRRHVITELMCNGVVRPSDVETGFGIDFGTYFAAELEDLTGPGGAVEEGMVRVDGDALVATDLGRLFIRNVAMAFDAYLRDKTGDRPVFSRTV
ncbi:MAG: oxygen-independent coproporphyrinogen III oxidase [Actinobacteria bacterium]|nr:oxygen-independent coproporphyrinogen III oxidase [Actinomycetota bacterium]MBU1866032.1 oxygen-independent coproporphyrinogen III oxidase [Actinomycetota bacterium]